MHMTVPERTQALSLHRGPALGSERTDDDIEGRGVIKLAGVTAGYGGEPVLSDVSLEIDRGDFVCVEGPSGVGKTTLLRVLYGLLKPLSGTALVDGVNLGKLRSRHVSRFRRRLGCVFQSYELLPQLTALENVLLPLQLAQYGLANPETRAADALEMVGLADKAETVPGELSGGQQQRVAIARAIAHEPSILLADEPTGNLDPISTAEVMHAFEAYHEQGGTVVMATHDELLRDRYARRVLRIQGRAA
jgi:cell division transport system ATP-binding protein